MHTMQVMLAESPHRSSSVPCLYDGGPSLPSLESNCSSAIFQHGMTSLRTIESYLITVDYV